MPDPVLDMTQRETDNKKILTNKKLCNKIMCCDETGCWNRTWLGKGTTLNWIICPALI